MGQKRPGYNCKFCNYNPVFFVLKIISYKQKNIQNKKVISFLGNKLIKIHNLIIINIGDENAKKRNVFKKNKRIL